MAKIKPSSREKKRYIVFEIISEVKFNFEDVKRAIIGNCLRYLGEFGCEKANIYVIKNTYLFDKGRGIIRVANKMVIDVKSALAKNLVINNQKVVFNIIGVSGIIKKAKNKFLFKE